MVTPSRYTVLGWDVEDIVATIQDLGKCGVRFERYDDPPQNEFGIWTAPGGAKIAWFKDPDGNLLSITESAQQAAVADADKRGMLS
jgi:catechol 2,3-dioxygenase-like lactoylglutathione lyase family enzyme